MIPKIIHYVWVGTAPKSDLVLKCIESWKKYCPDYEIREWNIALILSEIAKENYSKEQVRSLMSKLPEKKVYFTFDSAEWKDINA